MTAETPMAPPGARNATLADLGALLREQQACKVDIVAPASAIRARTGQLVVDDTAPLLGPDGVTMTTGIYTPTDVCDQGIADKLGIPAAYLRRMREHKPGLYDANVNGWLDGDDRRFLLRCLRPASDGGTGAVRAFLSDGYKIIDLSRSWGYPDGWTGGLASALVRAALAAGGVCVGYQRFQCTTWSKGRRLGLVSGRSGRSAGYSSDGRALPSRYALR